MAWVYYQLRGATGWHGRRRGSRWKGSHLPLDNHIKGLGQAQHSAPRLFNDSTPTNGSHQLRSPSSTLDLGLLSKPWLRWKSSTFLSDQAITITWSESSSKGQEAGGFVQCSGAFLKGTKTRTMSIERKGLSMISRYAKRGAIISDGLARGMR